MIVSSWIKVMLSLTGSALVALFLLIGSTGMASAALNVEEYPLLKAFIEEMHQKHDIDPAEMKRWFEEVTLRPKVIRSIKKPAEKMPWHRYRKLFLSSSRARQGAEFWKRYALPLERAEQEFGIPPEIIVAIIGVESRFGRARGGYPVIDSLTSLFINYSRRRTFFKSELENYLLLAEEEGLDVNGTLGSYAGAMGIPQFISSSYRNYAVDFNGDGRRDLIGTTEDAIGSVANYLKRHHWKEGGAIVTTPKPGPALRELATTSLKPLSTVDELSSLGVLLEQSRPGDEPAGVVKLKLQLGDLFMVIHHNFYVISRYNHSLLYSMVINDLAEMIRRQYYR